MNKNEKALEKLKSVIGSKLYTEVCEQMPGEDLHIPAFRGGCITLNERNKAVRQDVRNGLTMMEASEKWGLSIQQIYKIMASRKNHDKKP